MKSFEKPKGLIMLGTVRDLVEDGYLPNDPRIIEAIESKLGRVRPIGGKDSKELFTACSSVHCGYDNRFYSSVIFNNVGAIEPSARRLFEKSLHNAFDAHPDWRAFELRVDRGASLVERFLISRLPDESKVLYFVREPGYNRILSSIKMFDA